MIHNLAEASTPVDTDRVRTHPAEAVVVWSLSDWLQVCQHNVSSVECVRKERQPRDNNWPGLIDAKVNRGDVQWKHPFAGYLLTAGRLLTAQG